MNIEKVIKQEQEFSFQHFTHEFGLKFGLEVINYIQSHQLKSVGIRIIYKDLLIFQYLMDGKKEDVWLKRKVRTVLESGHSSYYTFLHQDQYTDWIDNDCYAVGGGGFPIIENNKVVGAICVSGLKHDEDHQLIVDILRKLKEEL
ncbi:heme-binding protein [Candidatus Stoquefichus massiliensis]|uniref:heme-binding protein n=1 Tax=Candidatus Stoquefichus massiliensis TaxID=1470350 RepID=UPI0004881997|nr:heme-binding protein [Candidatus Stoquefichus massiliensis]